MNDSMRKYMKVGLISFMAFPEIMKGESPVERVLSSIAADDYFDAVEVTWIKDDAARCRVRSILQTAHMAVAYGAQPRLLTTGLNPNSLEEGARAEAVRSLKEGIDEACELGAQGFAFMSGKYPADRVEDAYRALVASTAELCEYARSKGGLRVSLEVFDFDIDKRSLIGPAPLALRYAREIVSQFDNFGLTVDLSHIPMLHETIEESLLPVKEYIVHAHMGNCVIRDSALPGYGDSHPRFGFPGGENDVDELAHYLRVLLDIGFLNERTRPIVSFEVKPFGDEDPELVIANAKRTLNQAWAKV